MCRANAYTLPLDRLSADQRRLFEEFASGFLTSHVPRQRVWDKLRVLDNGGFPAHRSDRKER